MILKTVFYVIICKWLYGISNNSLIVFNDNFVIITIRYDQLLNFVLFVPLHRFQLDIPLHLILLLIPMTLILLVDDLRRLRAPLSRRLSGSITLFVVAPNDCEDLQTHVGTVLPGVNGFYHFIELREIPHGRPTMMANQQTILIFAYVDYKRKRSNMSVQNFY